MNSANRVMCYGPPFLFFLGAMIVLAQPVKAQPTVSGLPVSLANDPLPVQRILLPLDRLAAELERAREGVYVQVPLKEFDARLDKARKQLLKTVEEPYLIESRYRARFVSSGELKGLDGTAEWKLRLKGDQPGILPVDNLQLALRSARWPDNQPAVFAPLDSRQKHRLGLVVRPGDPQTLALTWSARGTPIQGELRFDLAVPVSPIAILDLDLPLGWIPVLSQTDAILFGPYPVPDAEQLVSWRIGFGGLSHLEFSLRPPASPDTPPTLLRTRNIQTSQEILPAQINCAYQVEFESIRGSILDLVVEHDANFTPQDVNILNRESWTVLPGPPGKKRIAIRLRSPTTGGQLRITGTSSLPVGDPASWSSPGMQLVGSIPGVEVIEVRISPALQLLDWRPGNFRLLKRQAAPDGLQVLTLESGLVANAAAVQRPSARLPLSGAEYRVSQQLDWTIGIDQSTLMSVLRIEVVRGVVGHLPLRLPPGWEVERIEASNRETAFLSRVLPGAVPQLHIELPHPLNANSDIEFNVHLRQRRLIVNSATEAIPFPDILPLNATRRSGVYRIRVTAGLQSWIPSGIVDEGMQGPLPLPQPVAGTVTSYPFVGLPPYGPIVLRLEHTRLRVEADSRITIQQRHSQVRSEWQITSEEGATRTLHLYSPVSLLDGLKCRVIQGPNAVLQVRRVGLGSVLGVLGGLGSAKVLSASMALMAATHGEYWEVEFARPLDQAVTVEMTYAPMQILRSNGCDPACAAIVSSAASLARSTTPTHLSVPLLQMLERGRIRGRITIPLADHQYWRWETEGVTPEPNPAPDGLAFVHANDPVRLTFFPSDHPRAIQPLQVNSVQLATIVHPEYTRCWLTFRARTSKDRTISLDLPAGVMVLGVAISGVMVEEEAWTITAGSTGVKWTITLPGDRAWHTVELLYRLAPTSGMLAERVNSPSPRFPVDTGPIRRRWYFAPGWLPLRTEGLLRLPDGPAFLLSLPWPSFQPVLTSMGLPSESLAGPGGVGGRSETLLRPRSNSRQSLQQWLVQSSLAGERWLLDTEALRRQNIVVQQLSVLPGSLPEWRELGLATVSTSWGTVLTTLEERSIWSVEATANEPVPSLVIQALAEATQRGRDTSGRFQTIADWLERGSLVRSPALEAFLGIDGAGWTGWEETREDTRSSLWVVKTASATWIGWFAACGMSGIAFLLLGRVRRLGKVLLGIWLAAAGIALQLLPEAIRSIAVGPMIGGILVAVVVICRRQTTPISLTEPPTERMTLSRSSRVDLASGTSILLVVCTLIHPTRAAAPEGIIVYLVPGTGKDREPRSVLVPPDSLQRLERLSESRLPCEDVVCTRVEYRAVSPTKAVVDVDAVFSVYAFTDQARLMLPLGGVRLREALIDGAPAFPRAEAADRFSIDIKTKGEHRLELKFTVAIAGSGAEREMRFTVPEILISELRFVIPRGRESVQAVNWRGMQRLAEDNKTLLVDLGRTRQIQVRWRESGITPVSQVRVQQASLWTLTPGQFSQRAILEYRIGPEGLNRIRVAIPDDLEVSDLEIRPESAITNQPPNWIKDWRLRPGGERKDFQVLTIELQAALNGPARCILDLVPRRRLGTRPDLRFPYPLDVQEVQAQVAFRLRGVDMVGEPQRVALAELAANSFLQDTWKRLQEEKTPAPVSRAYRLLRPDAVLRPDLRPQPAAQQGILELLWTLLPQRSEVRGQATWLASANDLHLVEWDMPAQLVLHAVRGMNVESWTRSGTRVQVWLKNPAREVYLWWYASLPAGVPKGESWNTDLPGVRMEGVASQETTVHLAPAEGYALQIDRPEQLGVPVETRLDRGSGWKLTRPTQSIRIQLRPPEKGGRYSLFTRIDERGDKAEVQTQILLLLRRDRPLTVTVEVQESDGNASRLEVAPGIHVTERESRRGRRSWIVDLPPQPMDRALIKVTTMVELEGKTEGSLPRVLVQQRGMPLTRSDWWIATVHASFQLEETAGLRQIPRSEARIPAWAQVGVNDFNLAASYVLWHTRAGTERLRLVRLVGNSNPSSGPRIELADLEAVPFGGGWLYRGTFEIVNRRGGTVQLVLDPRARLQGAILNGMEIFISRPEPSRLPISIAAYPGHQLLQCVWYQPEPTWDAPTFHFGSDEIRPLELLWTVYKPTQSILTGITECSCVVQDLFRADALLQIASRGLEIRETDQTQQRLLARAQSWLRLADVRATWRNNMNESEKGPQGQSLPEWNNQLREKLASLRIAPTRPEIGTTSVANLRQISAQKLPHALAFESGAPVHWIGTRMQGSPTLVPEDRSAWQVLPGIVRTSLLVALTGLFLLILLVFRSKTQPEQFVVLGILATLCFPIEYGVVFLVLVAFGIVLRLVQIGRWMVRWVG